MDEGGGLHSAARDSTAREAVPTLQASTAGHRHPGTHSNSKDDRGCFTCSSGTCQTASLHSVNFRVQLAQTHLYTTTLVRLIMEGVLEH